MIFKVLGATAMGLTWGMLVATIRVDRRPVSSVVWLLASTSAVAATATWLAGGGVAMWTVGAMAAGGLLRRTFESILEARSWK